MKAPLVLPTMRGYESAWLGPDLLAGLTLVAIAVPEQMATARLANMAAVTGLYTFVAGSLLFAVLGRDRNLSVGADSTIAPILAAGVAAVAAVGTPHYTELVSFLALMVGALVISVGLLRLGWISEFLSTPVITGVLAGIAVQILVRQLPAILGLAGGGTTTVSRLRNVVEQLGQANGWAMAIAAVVLGIILVAARVDRRIPGALIGIGLSIGVVAVFGLTSNGVAVLGSLHGGLPALGVPHASWADVRRLVLPALTVAFVCVAQSAATERASPAGSPDADDFNRDLVALGAGSVAAAFSGSFAANSSPPRTEVVRASGGRSQLTSVVAGVVSLAVVLFATGLLKDLPEAALGAILVFVATRLFRVRELRSILRFDRLEFGLAVVALLAVSFFGIEMGVVVALLVSLADRTRRAARPREVILGRVPGSDHWIPPDIGHLTEQVPGIIVYLIYAPLWYGNADHVRLRIRQIVEAAPKPLRALVLNANAMSDIDFTGARTLRELAAELEEQGVAVAIARASHLVHHDLKHSGLLDSIGPDRLFASVEDAVAAFSNP